MKKLLIILAIVCLLFPCVAMAAGTLADKDGGALTGEDWERVEGSHLWKLEFVATDDTNGIDTAISVPTSLYGKTVAAVKTDPGTTAPTADYDIAIWHDSAGPDLFGGNLADRSATVTEGANNSLDLPLDGDLVFKLSNNSVNNATVAVTLYAIP